MAALDAATQQQLRALAPEVLGILCRRTKDFAAAEDAVQEALIAAAQQWPAEGPPEHPRAWLVQVASRRLTGEVRMAIARRAREATVVSLVPAAAVADRRPAGCPHRAGGRVGAAGSAGSRALGSTGDQRGRGPAGRRVAAGPSGPV